MTHSSQLRIKDLRMKKSNNFEGVDTYKTKLIIGGTSKSYFFNVRKITSRIEGKLPNIEKNLEIDDTSINVTQGVGKNTSGANIVQRANLTID